MRAPVLLVAIAGIAVAGESGHRINLLPNSNFAQGRDRPLHWKLATGQGAWVRQPSARACLRVTGSGNDSSYWQSDAIRLQPGQLYELRFRARRRADASGGVAIVGTTRVNCDFHLTDQWQEYAFVFRQPEGDREDAVHLGQWHMRGSIEFDRVFLQPVVALHRTVAFPGEVGLSEWGRGETLFGDRYEFRARFGGEAVNHHRPLVRATARFNTDRWVFESGAEVEYHFSVPFRRQVAAELEVTINYHVSGRLLVEIATETRDWRVVEVLDGTRRHTRTVLPDFLLPATVVKVRLRTPDPQTVLQVNACHYTARLDRADNPALYGTTYLFRPHAVSDRIACVPLALEQRPGTARFDLTLLVSNVWNRALPLRLECQGRGLRAAPDTTGPVRLGPGEGRTLTCALELTEPGRFPLRVIVTEGARGPRTDLETVLDLSPLDDPRPGYPLHHTPALDLWWCESGWKISRERVPPPDRAAPQPVAVSLARREFEAAQLVLRPQHPACLQQVETTWSRVPGSSACPLELEIFEVAYVPVRLPSDPIRASAGLYPDPLPPLELPLLLPAHGNQPLWLRIYAPRHTPAGTYEGTLALTVATALETNRLTVPLRVHVYDFTLPPVSHLRSAFGLDPGNLVRYHKLDREEDRIDVYTRYLRNFAEHRISPYRFFDYAPIHVQFEQTPEGRRARVNVAAFDSWAEQWLMRRDSNREGALAEPSDSRVSSRQAGSLVGPGPRGVPFNSFQLPLHGMGGGTFHSRHLGTLEGHEEGTPEHMQLFRDYLGQVVDHLRQRGWLDLAYTYWFDEPDPKDYPFVVAGQERIRAAAPGLKRLLTEQPEPELLGHVDIWCALMPEWSRRSIGERKAAGEEVWWYICTVPKAPYITHFIDHPALELRLWPWQAWLYDIDGILIWSTTYWTSSAAYPDSLQDPWEDPMSWVSGYGQPPGTRVPWGNGDGRLLYPPRRNPNTATEPALQGPIDSIRWENLRDGMEDYEYLWLLREQVRRLESRRSRVPSGALAAARKALQAPEKLSPTLTEFTTDPRQLLEQRHQIARAIERLSQVRE